MEQKELEVKKECRVVAIQHSVKKKPNKCSM